MFSFRLILRLIVISCILLACKQEQLKTKPVETKIDTIQNQPKDTVKPTLKKLTEKKVRASWDTLHYNNVASFFTAYGKENEENKVLIKTKFGNIKVRLFNDTPIHRANFIFLVKTGYFNTTVFHRVAKDCLLYTSDAADD